jgi:arylsulfatase A-like enzyme
MDTETYSSDLFGLKASEIINSHDPLTNSMLLHFHFTAPHTPLQAPDMYTSLCHNVSEGPSEAYQKYYRSLICGMVVSIDINLLRVILTLYSRDMLSSTLILFHSDNGGYKQAGSSNLPFRGQKGTSYEGGVHVPAFIYGAALQPLTTDTSAIDRHCRDLFHVSDVLPTLLGYLGISQETISSYQFDGKNHWSELATSRPLQRHDIHIDSTSHHMAYSTSYLRIIQNVTYKYHYNPSVITFLFVRQKVTEEYEYEGEFLFDLTHDPAEERNLIPFTITMMTGQQATNNPAAAAAAAHRLRLILELMRQEVLKSRENSSPSLLTSMPPVYDFPPSPLGCWLPLDSPSYNTFDCGIEPNFKLPKLPPSIKFLYSFESLPKLTEEEQVVVVV